MTQSRKEQDQILDRAVSQIASSKPDPAMATDAADRVWSRIAGEGSSAAVGAAAVGEINSCDDYQALIPAYLESVLPEARRLLLEDHTRECVPCRRALKAVRNGESLPVPDQKQANQPFTRSGNQNFGFGWLATAAALIIGLGMAYYLVNEMDGSSALASVHTVDGQLFRVARAAQRPMLKGDGLHEGEVVRTGRDAGAILRLEDGSLVEMRERSEVAIEDSRKGTTVRLERGSVIVQAADQRQRHLFVATEDCLISVTGTIFSVDHGTKGSRVAVIEGEVHVNFGGNETVLEPGGQVSTHTSLDTEPLEQSFGWSRDVDQYLELLAELSDLRQEIRQSVSRPGLRYSSRLLDLMPEETAFYLAVPNFGDTVSETHRLIQDRLGSSDVLADWWQEESTVEFQESVGKVVDEVSAFSDFLGSELAVGGSVVGEELEGPLILADLEDEAGLREFVKSHLADISIEHHGAEVIFVEDPVNLPDTEGLYLWLNGDLLVGSPKAALIRRVAAVLEGVGNPFLGTSFYSSIAGMYAEGAGVMLAADVEGLLAKALREEENAEEAAGFAAKLGVDRARHLMAQQKTFDERAEYSLELTFSEDRQGVASWLAEPAPMGSLEFVSPDAKLAASFVVKDPILLFEDIEAIQGADGELDTFLQLFSERLGFDFREDLLATLGGELSIAVDGPLLPKPAWKLIMEVYDSARFQWVVEQGLVEVNQHLAEEGKEPLELLHEESGGRSYYSLSYETLDVHYAFVEGYLVVAPSRALVDRALRYRESGFSLTDASRFVALLPPGESNNFSALVFQDLSGVMESVASGLAQGELTESQLETLGRLQDETVPSLAYAYGESDRIRVAATSSSDTLSSLLLRLFGVKDPLGLDQLLTEAFHKL